MLMKKERKKETKKERKKERKKGKNNTPRAGRTAPESAF